MHATYQDRQGREQWKSASRMTVDKDFEQFVETELLPAAGIGSATFWAGLESIVAELTPENRDLLAKRDELQQEIDDWHLQHRGQPWDVQAYKQFLHAIGYLKATGKPFQITTSNVDDEIANVAGPQLVVPANNARFALNAANARWGSLFDALYGSDVIDGDEGREAGTGYNPVRGQAVIDYAIGFLDSSIPLRGASHGDVVRYEARTIWRRAECIATLKDGSETKLKDAWQFIGFTGRDPVRTMLFQNNGLHIELQIDADSPVGQSAPGNLSDVLMESAITTIQDCEDSVAAVDAEEKIKVYRNWLGLMQGTLSATFAKGDKSQTRTLRDDRAYTATDGTRLSLPGRSLMLVRNVGHLMQSDAVIDGNGEEIFEGILDAVVTVACALADHRGYSKFRNSRAGSIYIVKPKMHGPEEAAFANKLFDRVEVMFGLLPNTIKIGVMDEERRTTVNLHECIRAVRSRLVFINTGFLDRTGDEIHTSMQAGPVLPKEEIKSQPWITAYEDRNVDVGISCGLPGKAQIGKGMWAKPDEMRQMMDTKQAHPESGASCAWVPSPTAATLHAMHYHYCSVPAAQQALSNRKMADLDDILKPPLGDVSMWSTEAVQAELDNNAQGILGYVVRWVEQGIGCSKVPDIDNVGLMEDRATLRISSQHIANWLLHGICTRQQVRDTFERMAAIVDRQNADDPDYVAMSPHFSSSFAFNAALDLILKGAAQPNGYTEPLLHQWRRDMKRAALQAAST